MNNEKMKTKKWSASKSAMILLSILVVLTGVLALSEHTSAQNVTGADIVQEISHYVGYPIDDFDSAYAVQYIFNKQGISLPGTLSSLSKQGTLIRNGQTLRQGDILFFGTSTSNLLATGIYVGNNQFFIAHKPYGEARIMSMNSTDAKKYYLGAKRVIGEQASTSSPSLRDRVIAEGEKYMGTRYQFNSSRSSTRTFDCSDFVRRAYYEATGEVIPTNSRTQAAYIKQNGRTTTNWRNLSKGDLMFFTSPDTGNIYHVALYMGNGYMLHTYSIASGGVRVDRVSGFWNAQFAFGGNGQILD